MIRNEYHFLLVCLKYFLSLEYFELRRKFPKQYCCRWQDLRALIGQIVKTLINPTMLLSENGIVTSQYLLVWSCGVRLRQVGEERGPGIVYQRIDWKMI